MTPTIDLLRNHRSIRHFTDAPISDQQREAIIAGAQGASSSSFLQCTSIIRITDPQMREQLVELTGGQQHVAQAAEFWVFCADFNRHLQICPQAQLGLAEQLLRRLSRVFRLRCWCMRITINRLINRCWRSMTNSWRTII